MVDANTIITAVLIFVARTVDVSMGTVRQIMLIRGHRNFAAFIGFFEIMIWATAISAVVTQITVTQNYLALIALGFGFAVGNVLGSMIEEKIALGYTLAFVVPKEVSKGLETDFRAAGFGVTTVVGTGLRGPHPLYHTVFKRKDTKLFLKVLREHDPSAFFTLVDVRTEAGGFIKRVSHKKK